MQTRQEPAALRECGRRGTSPPAIVRSGSPAAGRSWGRGIVNYSSSGAQDHSGAILSRGHLRCSRPGVIHQDNWASTEQEGSE